MKISTITYNIRQGFKNIWRNKMFSIASIATMAACIFLLGIFYSIGTNFKTIVKEAEESVSVTVFFNEDQTDDQRDPGFVFHASAPFRRSSAAMPRTHRRQSAAVPMIINTPTEISSSP